MLDEKDLQQVKAIADEARRGAVHDMQVIIENTIMPSLKLLAEGQRTLLKPWRRRRGSRSWRTICSF